MSGPSGRLWGGRFAGGSDPLFRALNDSLRFDWRLVREDIEGSRAWARALAGAGVLNADESDRLLRALGEVERVASGLEHPPTDSGAEDVHAWVEGELIARVGSLGKKLHTGRSRNDQVATDLRLWTRGAIDARVEEIRAAQGALVDLAEREAGTVFPGYTHVQRAQPITLGHWCLSHFEALDRDAARLLGARSRVNLCPLGSGALAGCAYAVDRAAIARDLGMDGALANSLDATASRDFVVETLAAAAACAVTLSRLGEDLILYSSAEFGLVEMSDAVTSGSSLMPQKKNPDAMELLRGKAGRVAGALVSLLVTTKGLPTAYNKDLQEDKEPLFDAMEALSLCLRVTPAALEGLKVDRAAAARAAAGGYADATELADYLVGQGVAFRDAHDAVGRIVRRAIELGVALEAMGLDEMKRAAGEAGSALGADARAWLGAEAAVARRKSFGGTATERVREAAAEARNRLARNANNSARAEGAGGAGKR